jgi:predicted nucleotidyltransferase
VDALIDTAIRVWKEGPPLRLAVLFGSHAPREAGHLTDRLIVGYGVIVSPIV